MQLFQHFFALAWKLLKKQQCMLTFIQKSYKEEEEEYQSTAAYHVFE
jgi:hypothetical protein